MASLADFIAPRKTGGGLSQPQNVRGIVTTAPATLADKAFVVLPEFSGDYHWECDWMPRGALLPTLGVTCLVSFDNTGAAWITAWRPT